MTCFLALILCFLNLFAVSGDEVQVGQGSYSTAWPVYSGYGMHRPFEYTSNLKHTSPLYGPPIIVYKTANVQPPYPTNDWWSSVMWLKYSERMHSIPLAYQFTAAGMRMTTQNYVVTSSTSQGQWGWTDFTVNGSGMNPPDARLDGYSDWSADIRMADGAAAFTARLVTGSPFTYLTFENCNPVIQFDRTPVYSHLMDGTALTHATVTSAVVTTDTLRTHDNRGRYYGWFAPQGTQFQIQGGTMTLTLPPDQRWLVIGLLTYAPPAQWQNPPLGPFPNLNAMHRFYHDHAYAWPEDTRISWNYDRAASQVAVDYHITTSSRQYDQSVTLMGVYPHQYKYTGATFTGMTYRTFRGVMKLLAANELQTVLPFRGVLPYLPVPDGGSFDPEVLKNYVRDRYPEPIQGAANVSLGHDDWLDSYWAGKFIANVTNLMPLAHLTGDTLSRDHFKNLVRNALTDWFRFQPSLNENRDVYSKSFYYLNDWGGLFGFFPGYGSEHFNDHHFHYGYFIYSSALLAAFDPSFAPEYGGMVDLLIRDIASPDRDDPMFPHLRHLGIYHGHSWASGSADSPNGNNQESVSEALNAWAGVALWGAMTGNTRYEDLGVFLHALEYSAAREYWYDVDRDVYDHSVYNATYITSLLWGSLASNSTYFSNKPEHRHGIVYLPITPASLYLGIDPSFVQASYESLLRETNGTITEWQDLMAMFRAFYDPAGAVADYDDSRNPETGNSWAFTYNFLHNLDNMGQVDAAVTADTSLYAVFKRDGVRSYVAYNPLGQDRVVHFSDGFDLFVPARSLASTRGTVVPPAPDSTPPSRPTGLAAGIVTATSIQLSWNASTDASGVAGYHLYRGGTLWQTVSDTQFTDSGLTPSTVYSYEVSAFDYAGNKSLKSSPLLVTTAAPGVTSGFPPYLYRETYHGGNFREYHLNTSESSVVIDDTSQPHTGNYNIRLRSVGAGEVHSRFDFYYGERVDSPGLDLSAYDTLEFYMKADRACKVWLRVGDGYHDSGYRLAFVDVSTGWNKYTLNIRQMSVGNATDINVLLSVTIKAFDNGNQLNHTLYLDNVMFVGSQVDNVPPTKPSGLQASIAGSGVVQLAWQASTDNMGVAGYRVFRNRQYLKTVTGVQAEDDNVSENSAYSYQVAAEDISGNVSVLSDAASVTSSDTLPPTIPQNLWAAALSDQSIALGWDASTDNFQVVNYRVYRNDQFLTVVNETNHTDGTLSAGTTYRYRVSAVDGSGNESGLSQEAQATTQQAGLQNPWRSNENGNLGVNKNYNYTMGYRFKPLVDGQVTQLGGFFNGNRKVSLWDDQSGQLLAQTQVSSTNQWAYSAVTPVAVQAGKSYTVAVYLAGTGGSLRMKIVELPQNYGQIQILGTSIIAGDTRPTSIFGKTMYGQADISFVPQSTTNQDPSITSQPATQAVAGTLYQYQVTAADPDGDSLTFNLNEAPGGMTIGASSGLISWVPQTSDLGSHTVTVQVSDGRGGSAHQPYSITVIQVSGPESQTPWQDNENGMLYKDRPWNHTMGYHFTPQVDGRIIGLGGFFSGTKTVYLWDTASGALLAQAQVTSAYDWRYASISPISVTAGRSYTVAVYLAGSGACYRDRIHLLPRIYGDIQITGSTFVTGDGRPTNNYTTLMYGQVDVAFTTGDGGNQIPVVVSDPEVTAVLGTPYQYQVQATDGDGDTLTFGLATAPSGMTIHSQTGLIQWTPGSTGTFAISVSVTDGQGGLATQNFAVLVTDGQLPSQTPWQSNENGMLYKDRPWNHTMGYHFTPQVDGRIIGLGGFFSGTKTVYLWDTASGALLAQTQVTSAYDWRYTSISPISVTAGRSYTVAVYLAGSGACYRDKIHLLPRIYGDIQITGSTFVTGDGRPTNNYTTLMYGQVDIAFVPE